MINNRARKDSTKTSFHNFGLTFTGKASQAMLTGKASQAFRLTGGANQAFTLIELLVVMAVIVILAGMSLFALEGSRESSRDARRKSDLETIRSGVELYRADCNQYPDPLPAPGSNLIGDGTNCSASNVYIKNIPDDPITGRDYVYTASGAPPTSYILCAALEGDTTAAGGCGSCGSGTCSYRVDNP